MSLLTLTQKTDRHVVKTLDSTMAPATYTGDYFGQYGVQGNSTTNLAFPWGIAANSTNYFICDTKNQRIVKLDSSLAYVDSYSTAATSGIPYAIFLDSGITDDLYIASVWANLWVRVERLTTDLIQVNVSDNLHETQKLLFRPTGIGRGYYVHSLRTIIVSGFNTNLYITVEDGMGNFSEFFTQTIYGETFITSSVTSLTIGIGFKTLVVGLNLSILNEQQIVVKYDNDNYMQGVMMSYNRNTGSLVVNVTTIIGSGTYDSWDVQPKLKNNLVYNSIIRHSDDYIYLNNGQKILKINNFYENVGDTDFIAKSMIGLKEGVSGSLLTYVVDTQTIKRFDNNLNFVEDVFSTTGGTIDIDAYDVADFVEVSSALPPPPPM